MDGLRPLFNWAKYLSEPMTAEKPVNLGEWTNSERECFKRFFLIYGYGRWQIMRDAAKNAGYNLDDKSDEEMTQYANGFITALIEQLIGTDTKEIKQFLQSLIDTTNIDGSKIDSNPGMWGGEILLQRA